MTFYDRKAIENHVIELYQLKSPTEENLIGFLSDKTLRRIKKLTDEMKDYF